MKAMPVFLEDAILDRSANEHPLAVRGTSLLFLINAWINAAHQAANKQSSRYGHELD
jgi:hypothetical protein